MSRAKDTPPPLTEPAKRAGHEIEKGWPHLKAAPLAFLSVAGISSLVGFLLAWNIVVVGKNATIETLATANAEKDRKIDRLEKENDVLEKQNIELKTAIAESTAPLKKRTLVLANQLAAFTQQFTNDQPFSEIMQQYENRFPVRNERIAQQLDEAGQHSATIQRLLNGANFYDASTFVTNIMTLSREFQRLANNLE